MSDTTHGNLSGLISYLMLEAPPNKSAAQAFKVYLASWENHRFKYGSLALVQGDEYQKGLNLRHEYCMNKVNQYFSGEDDV
jgi:uncharacterized protein (DUF1015 family)